MENTLENKAKFFAQYWGQEVAIIPSYPEGDGKIKATVNRVQEIYYLELKSLSNLEDAEAIELAKKRGYTNIKNIKVEHEGYWVKFMGATQRTVFIFFTELYGPEVDYIRSIGYAYAFNGLSVEKQIKYGWVKLKCGHEKGSRDTTGLGYCPDCKNYF